MRITSWSVAFIAWAMLWLPRSGFAESATEKEAISYAHKLVNDYYGDRRDLTEAASIIGDVLRHSPNSADAYVEAARITIKGGHVVSNQFQPGTRDLYRDLVNKALAIDSNHVAALGLKAQIYLMAGNFLDANDAIQHGLKLSPMDPWLRLELATYYRRTNQAGKAMKVYETIITEGKCESDPEYRRACLSALMTQIHLLSSFPSNTEAIRTLAKRAVAIRHPRDAWTLGELGRYFAEIDQLDESIEYSRSALRLMNYGVGRMNLAVALYIKAALLRIQGLPNARYLREADELRVPEEDVLAWFASTTPAAQAHVSAVMALFDERKSR